MAIQWQKVYLCSNPQNYTRVGVTAKLIGDEQIYDPRRDTIAEPPHLDWAPAQEAHPTELSTEVRFRQGTSGPRSDVLGGGSITVGWSVWDGSCQLSGLVWNNGNPVNPAPNNTGSVPGGGVAFYDEDDWLTIAITNDLEGGPYIDLAAAQIAVTDRALVREQLRAMFSRFTGASTGVGRVVQRRPAGRLSWQELRAAPARLIDAPAPDLPGREPVGFVPWDKFRSEGLRLQAGHYTAFSVAEMAPGAAVLLRGSVIAEGEPAPVLFWAEQISVHTDSPPHGRWAR